MPAHPKSGGIYFVAPFPTGWEVCAFPFRHWPDAGHALIWELAVAPQLALRWARRLHPPETLDRQPRLMATLARQLGNLYDAVPRGRAQAEIDKPRRCVVYHGDDLEPAMGVTPGQIAKLLLLPPRTPWVVDDHEARNPASVRELERLLGIPD